MPLLKVSQIEKFANPLLVTLPESRPSKLTHKKCHNAATTDKLNINIISHLLCDLTSLLASNETVLIQFS